VALPSTAAAMAAEYQAWIDFFHAGKGDYDDFLKRLPANHSGVSPTSHPTFCRDTPAKEG
jgi:hypothetical protein